MMLLNAVLVNVFAFLGAHGMAYLWAADMEERRLGGGEVTDGM